MGIADFEAKDPPGCYDQIPQGYKAYYFKGGIGKLMQNHCRSTIHDQIYKYHSYIQKDRQWTKDALCHNMYHCRDHAYDLALTERIGMVIETLADFDKDNGLLRYLLTLEGPAYTCRRYWDWIEPWVHE